MVAGGGIVGVQAALELANAGYYWAAPASQKLRPRSRR